MAQPANKRTPLGIDAFWDKTTPNPPLCWEKWRVQNNLPLLAKDNIILDALLGPKPEIVGLPSEPIYEETIMGSLAQSERERNARNAQQKMNSQNKYQRLIEIGIICGDKPWPLVVGKTVSLLYWSIGVEGRRILNCKIPHIMIDTLSTAEIWKVVKAAFIRFQRSLLIVFLITKQRRGETVERFYGKLKELAKNCDFENKEETLIRDVFITNLIDPEIQKELLKPTALEMIISMELEMQNQHQIQQHNKTLIPASVKAIQFPSNPRSSNWSFSNHFQKPKSQPPLYCSNCGGDWLPNHRDKCIAKGKTCNNCGLMNHFAKVCRKQKERKTSKSQEEDCEYNE